MWDEVAVFVAVVEEGSFRGAAERLGIARSSVSRAVQSLEETLGARLLHRTTRQVAPSGAGQGLYARVAPLYVGLARAVEAIDESEHEPAGVLRVTSTADFATVVLSEVLARCVQRWPRLRVETVLTNRVVDLVDEGIDVALRTAIRGLQGVGPAQRVGTLSMHVHAAPAYLEARGTPVSLDDLVHHDVVMLRGAPALSVALQPRALVDDAQCARALVASGAGVGVLPSFLAAADVAAGRLVRVLPDHAVVSGAVWMVVPSPQPPPKVTAFRDVLREVLDETGLLAS